MSDRGRYECTVCGWKWEEEYDMNQCCPTIECDDCGEAYYTEEAAAQCCRTCSGCGCLASDCCGCGSCSGCGCDCSSCGCETPDLVDQEGASSSETEIATRFGLQRDRDLAQHAADYYLLLNMWQIDKHKRAEEKLESLVSELAPEIATYLDLAIGGEIRYAKVETYPDMEVSPGRERRGTRGLAWETWAEWKTLPERTEYAVKVFGMSDLWPSEGYGGPAWKSIAEGLMLRLKGMDDKLWLDRVWNLQHNGGCALNKVYHQSESTQFRAVLEAHGADDIETLLKYASKDVRTMWENKDYAWSHWAHEMGDRYFFPETLLDRFVSRQDQNKWRGQLRWQYSFTSE